MMVKAGGTYSYCSALRVNKDVDLSGKCCSGRLDLEMRDAQNTLPFCICEFLLNKSAL
jgi:hypothetical protein